MKEYILCKSFAQYLRIAWKYKIICWWIKSTKKLKDKDRFIVYTLFHKYYYDVFRTQKKNIFNIK